MNFLFDKLLQQLEIFAKAIDDDYASMIKRLRELKDEPRN